jgi:hypothetical protein
MRGFLHFGCEGRKEILIFNKSSSKGDVSFSERLIRNFLTRFYNLKSLTKAKPNDGLFRHTRLHRC